MAHTSKWLFVILLLGGCAQPEKPEASKILQDLANGQTTVKKKTLLGWNEKIDSTKFGLAANTNIDGKTLAEVISSQTAGRDDAQYCSACHNRTDAQGGYSVPADKNGASPDLLPTDTVYNRTWVGPGGWAERFINNKTKPANIKIFIQAWIKNGYK